MGYDKCECFICYCLGGGNHVPGEDSDEEIPTTPKHVCNTCGTETGGRKEPPTREICAFCIGAIARTLKWHQSQRVCAVINDAGFGLAKQCGLCNRTNVLTCTLTCCTNHTVDGYKNRDSAEPPKN